MNSSSGQAAKKKANSSQPSEPSFKRKRGMFQKDLQHMMYGFGDDPNPLPETVALVEDIVVEYIIDLANKAQEFASKRGKLLTEDFLYLMRKRGLTAADASGGGKARVESELEFRRSSSGATVVLVGRSKTMETFRS
ncbi:hypothetical protein HPP92_025545 [Vanilla planifolia]|uniref:Transcription initiation factor TFIID subunit 13 n=1 Tax=Vanilla planifolia TaxID=51239 RepID=A0A835PIN1_VANPL|nr:hypothetical protein HPP92_025545 [Vanilla planifolia]